MINSKSELAAKFWANGQLDDCPILDMHAHMGPFYGGYIPLDTAEAVLAAMDRSHVVLTCFVGHASLFAPDIGIGQDLAIACRYPDRFKLYHIVSSQTAQPKTDLDRIETNKSSYVGFKFLSDYYQVPLSDRRHQSYWEYANENRLLVLAHTWGGSAYDGPDEVEKILDRYPDLIFVAGHSFHGDWDSAVRLGARYPNLYMELTAVLDDRGALDLLVDKLGSEKILFGVDMPWFAYTHGIGAVLSADMTDEDRRNIFYRNGKRLLSRFPWFDPIWLQASPKSLP
ncbi:MAG: amidohydrolase family protein [Bacillota bacterium]|nr:amidohydrolase family protein [Bacillota bacterium]